MEKKRRCTTCRRIVGETETTTSVSLGAAMDTSSAIVAVEAQITSSSRRAAAT